jgi:hypothetical protein
MKFSVTVFIFKRAKSFKNVRPFFHFATARLKIPYLTAPSWSDYHHRVLPLVLAVHFGSVVISRTCHAPDACPGILLDEVRRELCRQASSIKRIS